MASHFATLCEVSVGSARSSRSRQHSLLPPNASPPRSSSTPPRACSLTRRRARVRSPSTNSSAATPSTRRRLRQTAAGHDVAVVCIDDNGKAAAAGTTISGDLEPVVFIGWGGKVVVADFDLLADLDVLLFLARGGKVVLVDEQSVVCTADGGHVVVDLGLVVQFGVAGRVCIEDGQRRRRARRRQRGRPGARAGAFNRRCGRPRRRRRPLRGRRRRYGCGCSAAIGNDAHVGNCGAVGYVVVAPTAWLSASARRWVMYAAADWCDGDPSTDGSASPIDPVHEMEDVAAARSGDRRAVWCVVRRIAERAQRRARRQRRRSVELLLRTNRHVVWRQQADLSSRATAPRQRGVPLIGALDGDAVAQGTAREHRCSPHKKRLLSAVEVVATVASGLPDQEQGGAGAVSIVDGGTTGVAAPLEPWVGRSDSLLVSAATPQVARVPTWTPQAAGTPVVPLKGEDRPAINTASQQHQQRDEACIPLAPVSFPSIVDNSVIDAGRRRRETASTKAVAFPIVSLRSSSPPPKMRAYGSVRHSWRRAHAPPPVRVAPRLGWTADGRVSRTASQEKWNSAVADSEDSDASGTSFDLGAAAFFSLSARCSRGRARLAAAAVVAELGSSARVLHVLSRVLFVSQPALLAMLQAIKRRALRWQAAFTQREASTQHEAVMVKYLGGGRLAAVFAFGSLPEQPWPRQPPDLDDEREIIPATWQAPTTAPWCDAETAALTAGGDAAAAGLSSTGGSAANAGGSTSSAQSTWSDVEVSLLRAAGRIVARHDTCRLAKFVPAKTCPQVAVFLDSVGRWPPLVESEEAVRPPPVGDRDEDPRMPPPPVVTASTPCSSQDQTVALASPFSPCRHVGPCDTRRCRCKRAGILCEKYCGCCSTRWAPVGPSFMRTASEGLPLYAARAAPVSTLSMCPNRVWCACEFPSRCATNACPWFKADRECDPDACTSCGAQYHPSSGVDNTGAVRPVDGSVAGGAGSGQLWRRAEHPSPVAVGLLPRRRAIDGLGTRRCRNVQQQVGARVRLVLGRSGSHGLGGFAAQTASCGDLGGDYVGELVTTAECHRRRITYDAQHLSYLYSAYEAVIVDATHVGSRTKFINHSSRSPNVQPRLMSIAGDIRVACFAARPLAVGEELFFDYGYELPAWRA